MVGSGSENGEKPLSGVRVLALEQMQALPFATQLLGRLGAEVIKVEPIGGEAGRAARPAMTDAAGRPAGATFLRYNLGKRSIAVDLKSPRGRDLVLDLAGTCDVVAENLGPGRADRLGVGHSDVTDRHPGTIYLSISGFGRDLDGSPYATWPAYASVAEAMSGSYEYARRPHQPPIINPMGGLGDTGTGLFAVIGILAALRHRDRTGRGQLIDVAMFDAMLAIADVPTNFWSLGMRPDPDVALRVPYLLTSFRAADGWCVLQVIRDHQFKRLATLLGHDEWLTDPRFATGYDWYDRWEDTILPAVEAWAGDRTMLEAATALAATGVVAAPCFQPGDVVADPHVARRNMLVPIERTDGVEQPVLVAGNPIKLSDVPEHPEGRPPYAGEHTTALLTELLGLDPDQVADLVRTGIVGAPSPG